MSVLTKILIVVFVVLAIFASTVFIAMAMDPTNWKAVAESRERANALKTVALQKALNAKSAQADAHQADIKQKDDRHAADQATISDGNRTNTALETENATLKNREQRNSASLAGLRGTLSEAQGANKLQDEQLTKNRADKVGLNEQLRKADQTLAENELTIIGLKENLKINVAKIDDLEARMAQYAAAGRVMPTERAPGIRGVKIIATVRATRPEQNLAELNVGSADGVAKGMRFVIYRGDKWVADLDIENVYPNTSAGVLVNVQMDPQQGDKATNADALSAAQ